MDIDIQNESLFLQDYDKLSQNENENIDNIKVTVRFIVVGTIKNPRFREIIDSYVKNNSYSFVEYVDEDIILNGSCVMSTENDGDNNGDKWVYVLEDFESKVFDYLKCKKCTILGPMCVEELIRRSFPISQFKYNCIYCFSLVKSIIVFSGFEKDKKTELSHLTKLAHYMGARVKLEINKSVTHLISYDVRSSLYEDAIGMGIDVVNLDWLKYCWENRDDLSFNGTERHITKCYRLKPFSGLCIAFHGFGISELKHMEEIGLSNGAIITDIKNICVTHIVVDEAGNSDVSSTKDNVWIVSSQWFWKSVQFQVNYIERYYTIQNLELKKKKIAIKKDIATSPKYKNVIKNDNLNNSQLFSKQTHTFNELLNTEKNYINILHALLDLFKDHLEKHLNDPLGPLMPKEDIRIVFDTIPDILKIHIELYKELEAIQTNWNCKSKIGGIFDKYIDPLLKTYPLFINFFEIIKTTIEKHDTTNQRFHAFLKCCLSDPRCNRQSLNELLIRPVQRLPSIILLLKEYHKCITSEHDDYLHVNRTIDNLTFVLNQINEDKKRTSEHLQMVEMYNNIENCPPFIMSATRNLLMKLDAYEFVEFQQSKYQFITLFIMTDSIEVTKKRLSNQHKFIKSSSSISSLSRHRSFKHYYFIPFNNISCIYNMPDTCTPSLKYTFGLTLQLQHHIEPITIFYQIVSNQNNHPFLLNNLNLLFDQYVYCPRQIYDFNNTHNTSAHSTFKKPDNTISTLTKALENFAFKATRRMSRAFSINNRINGLPRSISVTSQITNDSNNIFALSNTVYHSRKSIQPDNISYSNENSNVKKTKNSKISSLFRRSIQSNDLKR